MGVANPTMPGGFGGGGEGAPRQVESSESENKKGFLGLMRRLARLIIPSGGQSGEEGSST